MSENTTELHIQKLEERIVKDEAKIRRLRAKNRKLQRAADTRRKILLGSLLMKLMEKPSWLSNVRPALMNYLKREQDKNLFDEQWWNTNYSAQKPEFK